MKLICNNKDITDFVLKVTLSGDKTTAAKKLEVSLSEGISASIKCGDYIVFADSQELFRGCVFTREKQQSSKTIQIEAYDQLIYLTKSNGTYNFKNMTPEGITSKVCKDFGIPTGSLAYTGINLKLLFKDKSIYNIIQTAYTKAYLLTGKKYMPLMKEGKLNVIVQGENVIDFNSSMITDTYSKDSIDDMVNKIKIYDSDGKYISTIENPSLVKIYGSLQQIYTKEDKVNPYTAAKNMLKNMEKTITLDGVGDNRCTTGNAIRIKVANGLSGLFFIDGDTHSYENGVHQMSLTLNYQNLMDSQNESEG